MPWSDKTSDAEAHRRAGGRRRYNAQRQRAAHARRREVARRLLMCETPASIARALGVHRSTISRDVHTIKTARRWQLWRFGIFPGDGPLTVTGLELVARWDAWPLNRLETS